MSLLGWAATLVMFLAILLIPLGWPGLWIMVAVVGLGALLGQVGLGPLVLVLAIAGAAELLEFLIVRRMSLRYGGTNRAFWGAILGGTVGVLIGVPIPVLGPVIAGVIGSFLGAGAMALHESRDLAAATRVGWGVVLARALAAAVKVAAAFVVLAIGGTAWIVR
jgi:uncharacterized protein YqgC (DUF456 family)